MKTNFPASLLPGRPSDPGLSPPWCTQCTPQGCTLHSQPVQKEVDFLNDVTSKKDGLSLDLLANLLAPGLTFALGPVPAHLLLEKNSVSNVAATQLSFPKIKREELELGSTWPSSHTVGS